MGYTFSKKHRLYILVVLGLVLFSLIQFQMIRSLASGERVLSLVPAITATKTVGFAPGGDVDNDGKADPGDTLQYTVTINNAGTDATGVTLSDTLQNITSLSGTANIVPIARADSYNAVGNTLMAIPTGAGSLLSNDSDLDGGTLSITGFGNTPGTANANAAGTTITSTNGGSLTVSSDGSFNYTPPRGLNTAETFNYTISDGQGGTNTAQVTINVNGMIWYVNPAVASDGDGRSNTPYKNLSTFNTANGGAGGASPDNNDVVFLYSGSHTAPLTLRSGQLLIGQGASAALVGAGSITGITAPSGTSQVPSTGGASPVITSAGTGIVLNTNNTIRGLTIGNVGTALNNAKIFGTSFGTLTLGNSTTPDVILNGTGCALNLTTGTFAATTGLSSVTTTSANAQGINLAGIAGTASLGSTTVSGSATQGILVGTTTANINFGNTSVTGGTDGTSFQNNSSGTRTIGTLNVSGSGASAFNHGAGGGNVTVTGAATLSSANSAVAASAPGATNVISFQGATSATTTGAGNTAVNWAGVAGASITFNSLTIQRNNATALNATGGGIVTVTNNTGQINNTTPAGAAITGNGVTLNLNFSQINSTGGTSGISLTNVTGTSNLGTGALSGASTQEVLVSGGNPVVTYSGTVTQNNAQRVVDIQGTTGNTVTLSGTITGGASSLGLHIGDTSAVNGNVALTTLNLGTSGARMTNQAVTIGANGSSSTIGLGTVSIFTSGAQGLGSTNFDGILNISGGTFDSSTATAINIDGPAGLTTLGISLSSVTSVGGTTDGISIQDTNGSFTINGDGANTSVGGNSTGGTISNKSGADGNDTQGIGVFLSNATNITLRRMTINGTNQNFGVRGNNVNGFVLEFATVGGSNGTSAALDEGTVNFSNLIGTAAVTSCSIDGGFEDNLALVNTSGTLNRLTISSTTFGFNNTTSGNNNIRISSQNAGTTLNFTLKSSLIKGARADWITAIANSGSTMDAVIGGPLAADGNNFDNLGANAHPGAAAGGNRLVTTSVGSQTVDIRNNALKGSKGEGMLVRATAAGAVTGNLNARVRNNTIGVAATANSGSTESSGIFLTGDGGSHINAAITSNQVFQYNNHGIRMDFGDEINDGATYNVTVTQNTVSNPGNLLGSFNGIHLNNGTVAATDNFITCVDVGGTGVGNSVANSGSSGQDIRLRQRQSTTVRLPGYGGANNNDAAVATYLLGRNTAASAVSANTVPTGGGFIGGATCTQPSFASLSIPDFYKRPDDLASMIDLQDELKDGEGNASKTLFASSDSRARKTPNTESRVWNISGIADSRNPLATGFGDAARPPDKQFDVGSDRRLQSFDAGNVKSAEVFKKNFSDIFRSAIEIAGRFEDLITPTAYAQKVRSSRLLAPESGETIGKGPFTLQAGESVQVQFKATVNNGPFAAGVNNITNQASVSGSNFSTVATNTTSIPLDAAPDLSVTDSDGATATEPGGMVVYTLSYGNGNAVNGQGATGVTLTETVPANTTFTTTGSSTGWSCANGSPAGTVCTKTVGALNANSNGSATFAVIVNSALPVTALSLSDMASISDDGTNGADLSSANNSSSDTDTKMVGLWLGTTNTDWQTATNWSNGIQPPDGNNISIPGVANKPSVTTTDVLINDLTLNGDDMTIGANRIVTVTGNIALGGNNVLGSGKLSIDDTSAVSRTTGHIECTLEKTYTSPQVFTYPVGTTGAYSPVDVNVTNGPGILSVLAHTGTAPASPPLLAANMLQRYWTLNGSGITANVTFHYLDGDVPGTSNESQYRIFRIIGGGTALSFQPDGTNVILNTSANTFTVNQLNNFSDWTAGNPLAPTAAPVSISGRVLTPDGKPIAGASVAITGQQGTIFAVRTNTFGYYRVEGILPGETYIISVRSKEYRFTPRAVSVLDEIANFDLVADP